MAYEEIEGTVTIGGKVAMTKIGDKEYPCKHIMYDTDTGNYMFLMEMGDGKDNYGLDTYGMSIRGIGIEILFSIGPDTYGKYGDYGERNVQIWTIRNYYASGEIDEEEIFEEVEKAIEAKAERERAEYGDKGYLAQFYKNRIVKLDVDKVKNKKRGYMTDKIMELYTKLVNGEASYDLIMELDIECNIRGDGSAGIGTACMFDMAREIYNERNAN